MHMHMCDEDVENEIEKRLSNAFWFGHHNACFTYTYLTLIAKHTYVHKHNKTLIVWYLIFLYHKKHTAAVHEKDAYRHIYMVTLLDVGSVQFDIKISFYASCLSVCLSLSVSLRTFLFLNIFVHCIKAYCIQICYILQNVHMCKYNTTSAFIFTIMCVA